MTYVSDHAVLRYLERVKGIDIEAVRRELMTPAVEKAIEIGCDTVKRGDGSRLKLVGDVVSTVLPPKGVDRHHRFHGGKRHG